ncbi:MAG: hypothetical protein AAF790_04525, partial [Planctomycetota bacterium]
AYRDSLATCVDLAEGRIEADRGLAAATHAHAVSVLESEGEPELIDTQSASRRSIVAALCLAAVGVLSVTGADALPVYLSRLALSPDPWPRRVRLTLEGFTRDDDGVWRRRIARGESLDLAVRADLTDGRIDPGEVWLRYAFDGGRGGRASFARVGKPVGGDRPHQLYRHTLEDIASTATLRIRGGDARIDRAEVIVSPRPAVVGAELEVAPPAYLEQPVRRAPAAAVGSVPEGARVSVRFAASKPLASVTPVFAGDEAAVEPVVVIEPGESRFTINLPPLARSGVLRVSMTDAQGIASAQPYTLPITVEPDNPPAVTLTLVGVGLAVTPDADIGYQARLRDDHGIGAASVAVRIDDAEPEYTALEAEAAGRREAQIASSVDLLTRRFAAGGDAGRLTPGQRITLTSSAADKHNLQPAAAAAEPQPDAPAAAVSRTTTSQRFVLEVVTTNQLLAQIEQREVNLRRTFERVVADGKTLKRGVESLSAQPARQSESGGESTAGGAASAIGNAAAPPADADAEAALRRRLRLARLSDDAQKLVQETRAVAESFRAIHVELLHNRVPNQDLLDRIDRQIARPLASLCDGELERLVEALQAAEQRARDGRPPALGRQAPRAAAVAVQKMQAVLDQMKSLETYNEVLAVLRRMIDEQQRMQRATEKTRRERLRRMLLD